MAVSARDLFALVAGLALLLLLVCGAAALLRHFRKSQTREPHPQPALADAAGPYEEDLGPDPFRGDLSGPDVHLYPPANQAPLAGMRDPANLLGGAGEVLEMLAEYDGKNVQDIDVRGAIRTSEGDVLRSIRTRKGNPFDQREWQQDWRRLDESRKFVNVRITEPVTVPGGIRLTIDLIENPVIESVKLKGQPPEAEKQFIAAFSELDESFAGDIYDKPRLSASKLAFENLMKEKGHPDAKLNYTIEELSTHNQTIGTKVVTVPDSVRITFELEMGAAARIQSLALKNNAAFGEQVVLRELRSKEDGPFAEKLLASDRGRIAAFYRRNGYADVQVGETQITPAGEVVTKLDGATERLFDVSFEITEGEQHVVGSARFRGNTHIAAAELERVLKTKPGALLLDDTVAQDRARVQQYYAERGWADARVDAIRVRVKDPERQKFSGNLWDVTFRVTEGAKPVNLNFATPARAKTDGVRLKPNDPPKEEELILPILPAGKPGEPGRDQF